MRSRLLIAVLLGLVLAAPSKLGISDRLIKGPSKTEVIPIAVAAVDIPRGMLVSLDLIKTRDYPKDLIPPGAISKLEDAIDRTVAIPLTKDDPVLDNKLTPRARGAVWPP